MTSSVNLTSAQWRHWTLVRKETIPFALSIVTRTISYERYLKRKDDMLEWDWSDWFKMVTRLELSLWKQNLQQIVNIPKIFS